VRTSPLRWGRTHGSPSPASLWAQDPNPSNVPAELTLGSLIHAPLGGPWPPLTTASAAHSISPGSRPPSDDHPSVRLPLLPRWAPSRASRVLPPC